MHIKQKEEKEMQTLGWKSAFLTEFQASFVHISIHEAYVIQTETLTR